MTNTDEFEKVQDCDTCSRTNVAVRDFSSPHGDGVTCVYCVREVEKENEQA